MTAVAPPPAALPTTTASSSVAPSVEVTKPPSSSDDKPAEKPLSKKKEVKKEEESTDQPKSSDEGDAKATNPQSPTNPAETSTTDERPRATSGARSLFDLEPNPFEQSFSKGSHPSDRTTPPRGGDATSVKHNALPPLSSLTSPAAADPNQFPWLAGHSLRSGPLSPAMLAGPAQGSQQPQPNAAAPPAGGNNSTWVGGDASNNEGNSADQESYEPGNFRTGFTPGTGTGFTPGYNALLNSNFGGAIPMPSPNTAAFLNSITNVNENGGGEQNNGNQPNAPGGGNVMENRPPPSAIPPHLQPQTHGPVAPPLNPGNAVPDPNALNALGAVANNMNRGGPPGAPMPGPQSYYPPGMHPGGPGLAPGMPPVDYAQQNANAASQAANGLFLLSQAHQELSKREREEAQSSPLGKRGAGAPPKGPAGQKRKDSAPKGGAAKRGKKKEESISSEEEEELKEQKKPNRPETEEEKRRNFLERNRQAALKCRQRKKAWLNELQNKVETLSVENERLTHTVRSLEDELQRMSTMLMQHRDCGLAVPPAPMAPTYGRPLR